MQLAEIFRNRVVGLLAQYGSKSKLADALGISRSHLDGYLSGKHQPQIGALEKLAEISRKQPWELLKPDNAEPTPPRAPDVEKLIPRLEQLNPGELKLISQMIEIMLINARDPNDVRNVARETPESEAISALSESDDLADEAETHRPRGPGRGSKAG